MASPKQQGGHIQFAGLFPQVAVSSHHCLQVTGWCRLSSHFVANPAGCHVDSSRAGQDTCFPMPNANALAFSCALVLFLLAGADRSLHLKKEISGVLDNVVAAMIEAWNAERGLPEGIQNARANDPDESVRWVSSCINRVGSVASPAPSLCLPRMQPLWLACLQPTACQHMHS